MISDQSVQNISLAIAAAPAIVFFSEHSGIVDCYDGYDFAVARSDRLLIDFKIAGVPAIKPSIRANAPWVCILSVLSEQNAKGETLRIKLITGKPPFRNARCSREPFAPFLPVAHENSGGMVAFNETNSGRRPACLEFFCQYVHRLEGKLGVLSGERVKEVVRHQEIGREGIGDTFR